MRLVCLSLTEVISGKRVAPFRQNYPTWWKRQQDVFGTGFVINGLSPDHRNFLNVGGYGFMIGDGKLTYGTERIFETYYKASINSSLHLSLNYQFIQNPAYNKDRGPIQLWAIRAHFDY
ncbi:carbohydrate porin [uncultured Spirosoma sp.]|uniref:carbohydrate porin n=1 Tax=uncultured Spirosoma sp. TaxID=278208 RepID=UPI00261507AF|nr:carbohydrate porin [uncultured Spirosoma sp.]